MNSDGIFFFKSLSFHSSPLAMAYLKKKMYFIVEFPARSIQSKRIRRFMQFIICTLLAHNLDSVDSNGIGFGIGLINSSSTGQID